jgi:SpoVK/Ycf46/Vps4 family AAA+-type ATPase
LARRNKEYYPHQIEVNKMKAANMTKNDKMKISEFKPMKYEDFIDALKNAANKDSFKSNVEYASTLDEIRTKLSKCMAISDTNFKLTIPFSYDSIGVFVSDMSHENEGCQCLDCNRIRYREACRAAMQQEDRIRYREACRAAMQQEDKVKLNEIIQQEKLARATVVEWLINIDSKISLNDVVGNEKAKEAIIEAIIDPIDHADLFTAYGKATSKGLLLYGAPGNGKTMLVKAVVSELYKCKKLGSGMILVKGSSLASMWYGETERNIRKIYAYARAYYARYKIPLIVFIDEADSILMSRSINRQVDVSAVSTFLVEMDGLDTNCTFTILATNRSHVIDDAILRDGRIDRRIKVEQPSFEHMKILLDKLYSNYWKEISLKSNFNPKEAIEPEILTKHTMQLIINNKKSFGEIALNNKRELILANNFMSGAIIVGIVERAKMLAIKHDKNNAKYLGIQLKDVNLAVEQTFEEMLINEDTVAEYANNRYAVLQLLVKEKLNFLN